MNILALFVWTLRDVVSLGLTGLVVLFFILAWAVIAFDQWRFKRAQRRKEKEGRK